MFANGKALSNEDECRLYIKHTMTDSSAFEWSDYINLAKDMFKPFIFKGFRIGMTICYDCNHSLFSRMYALNGGVDLILNSTGGNVIYDKWYKYNKVRAIENSCYNLVTMGGDDTVVKSNCYVYGFNANGGQLAVHNLYGDSGTINCSGGLYVYEVTADPGLPLNDTSLHQKETINKHSHIGIPVNGIDNVLAKAEKVRDGIYRLNNGNENIIIFIINGMDIMKPEKILSQLYARELKKYSNRRYIIVNKHDYIEKEFFNTKLSVVLKVRAMENFCTVIVESDNINKCYQSGKNRTAQVIKPVLGNYEIDLIRTSGPEAIWKNKIGMKSCWRENFERLVDESIIISKLEY